MSLYELSGPWDGITVGDCGPYSSQDWTIMLGNLHLLDPNYGGILWGFLCEAADYASGTQITVHDGGALVRGRVFQMGPAAGKTFDVPTPVSARSDRIVVRCDWAEQTIRLVYLQNAAEDTGEPPALVQNLGDVWDIPVYRVDVTSVPVITVTDERERALPGLRHFSSGGSSSWTFAANAPSAATWYDLPASYNIWCPWQAACLAQYVANYAGPLVGDGGHAIFRLKVEHVHAGTTDYLEEFYESPPQAAYSTLVHLWGVTLAQGSHILTPQIYRSSLPSPDAAEALVRRLTFTAQANADMLATRL